MPMCCVPGCSNRSGQTSMYIFPKDKILATKWQNSVRRENWTYTSNSVICSTHFVDEDKTRVPSIFPWNRNKNFESSFEKLPNAKSKSRPDTKITQPASSSLPIVITKIVNKQKNSTKTNNDNLLVDLQNKLEEASKRIVELETIIQQKDKEILFLKENRVETKLDSKSIHNLSVEQFCAFTGLPSHKSFNVLFKVIEKTKLNYYYGWDVKSLNIKEQLFIFLVKLKLDLPNIVIGTLFDYSKTTISNIFNTFLRAFYDIFFEGDGILSKIPSRFLTPQYLPRCFQFMPNCRIVLDCAEFWIESPSTMKEKKVMYSYYKSRMTAKCLIGCAPNGTVTFISDLYGGSTSDKAIVKDSGVLEKMEPGDLILADKGFELFDILPPGVSLNIPSFLTNSQFTALEIKKNKQYATARVIIERLIGRVRIFKILNCIKHSERKNANMIVKVCCALTLFMPSLYAELEKELNDVWSKESNEEQ